MISHKAVRSILLVIVALTGTRNATAEETLQTIESSVQGSFK